MTKRFYDTNCSPEINEGKEGKIEYVNHAHRQKIEYAYYGFRERKSFKTDISEQIAAVKGCQAFFKSLAENPDINAQVRALAAGAAAEDEAQLVELERNRSSSGCSVL